MLKVIQIAPYRQILKGLLLEKRSLRTFLSQAYYCEESWNQRLNNPILQKVNLEELYYDLDQRYQKTKQLNAIDIDVFANAIRNESFCDELLDIIHKLRLTADTCNTPKSTSHAVVRVLLQFGKIEDLLNALDDRLNYGLFLDYYTANLLMDTFWKSNNYAHGVRVASQLMLQEELEHPVACNFTLLHCYNYLLDPQGWPTYNPPPEPEEDVKIRVKYLRNPYNDEHFDLRDDKKIVGKILVAISKNKGDPLHQSFHILGLALFGKTDKLQELSSKISSPLYKEILDLIPEDTKNHIKNLQTQSADVKTLLIDNLKQSYEETSEKDISEQHKIFKKWENDRMKLLEEQKRRMNTAKRIQNIGDLQKALKEKEERLWFFDREEQIDLAIEAKKKFYPKRWFGHKKKPKKVDEGYVPPEVQNKQIGSSQLG